MKRITIAFVMFFAIFVNYGQVIQKPIPSKSTISNDGKNLNGVLFLDAAKNYSSQYPEKIFQEVYNSSFNITFKLVSQESDELGYLNQKYQQYYNGVKVEFGTVTF